MADRHFFNAYQSEADLSALAVEFLGEGLERNEKSLLVAPGPVEQATETLQNLGDIEEMVHGGQLSVQVLPEFYPIGRPIDPDQALSGFAATADYALAEGFSGVRILAVLTELFEREEDRRWLARWEFESGRFQRERPVTSVCAYDRRRLSDDVIADLAALHEQAVGGPSPSFFHLFSLGRGRGLRLVGELDALNVDRLARTLAAVDLEETDEVLVDASRLDYLDHRALLTLDHFARSRNRRILLQSPPPATMHLLELLRLEAGWVEVA